LFQTALGPIAHATSISSAGILRAYDQIKGQTLGGLLPEPVTYTAGKPSPTLHCYWAYDAVVGQTPTTKQVGRNGNNGTAGLASSCNDE
jgi:branched-chain amino acid transport system substrate-binding protein